MPLDRLLVRGAASSVLVEWCSMLSENGETERLEPLLRRHGSDKGNEVRGGAAGWQASCEGVSRSCATSRMFDVGFGSFGSVVGGVFVVSLREDGMVSGFFMVPGLVVLGRFTVVSSSLLVMLGGGTVMLCRFFGHNRPLLSQILLRGPRV